PLANGGGGLESPGATPPSLPATTGNRPATDGNACNGRRAISTFRPARITGRCSALTPAPRLALDARDGVMSGNSIPKEEESPTMRLTAIVHHLMPFVAFAGGILVLLMPRLLNYIVAIYLILVGFIGLNSLFHFVR